MTKERQGTGFSVLAARWNESLKDFFFPAMITITILSVRMSQVGFTLDAWAWCLSTLFDEDKCEHTLFSSNNARIRARPCTGALSLFAHCFKNSI